jgi:GNAT superfamily N-acetyltransferase
MFIRKSTKEDIPFILKMIQNLADFEKASHEVKITEKDLLRDGFSEKPLYESIIIEHDNKKAGFALFYNRYSTWKGKSLYLEDLFILPEFRGNGLGRKTMNYLEELAKETNCGRFEWQVLDWNTPAIDLYKSMGADLDAEWINCRITLR